MPGERTPDTSPNKASGSSDDDISLREHVQRQLDTLAESIQVALDAALAASQTLNREQDRRYEQRFVAQEQAVQLALARVDKEFHEHLAQVRAETHAALEAADKAIAKSENATERRFESVNEFRQQLNDQARTFMGRDESISRHERTTEMIASQSQRHENEMRLLRERFEQEFKQLRERHEADISQVNSRLDVTAGRSTGLDKAWGYIIGAVGLAGGVIAIIIAIR